MPDRSLAKDFHSLMRNIGSVSDGQATVTKWDDENLGNFQVTVAPNDGPYKDGEFVFEIEVQKSSYPVDPPRVSCKTAIYHPNIDTIDDPEGEICFNLFEDDMWTEKCGLEDIVQGLLFLLYHPNWDDALVSLVPPLASREQVDEYVQKSLRGGLVWKYWFPPNPRYARLHPEESGAKVESNENEQRGGEGEGLEQKSETADDTAEGVQRKAEDSSDGATENKFETLYFGIKMLVDFDSDEDEDDCDDDYDEDEDEEGLNGSNRVHTLLSILRRRRSRMVSPADTSDEDSSDDDDDDDGGSGDDGMDSVHQGDVSPVLCSDVFAPCNIDSDVVNDEELEELLELMDSADDDENDNADPTVDSSRKNGDGFESVISWSRVVYGDGSSTSTRRMGLESEFCLTPVIHTTSPGQLKNVEYSSPRTVHRPTVMSRFFLALRTRTFRRWLV
ncbi:uncharacterized protein [Diadema setosum]|uniref:uncharacterized protein n=1 Tax=Diadema setosum TaxID=31175 RepID=UPI003B3BE32B